MSVDSVLVDVTIDATADVAWRFLTIERGTWWPDMRFEAFIGSPLVETWIEGGQQASATGEITRCEKPRLLAFRWNEPGWEHPLDVVIRLVAGGPSTIVTITESGFVRARTAPSLPDEHAEGWRYHLMRWKRASEGDARDADAQ
ncbi:MAG: SRPBCC domain-containing protein [Microbacterium sp.]